MAVQGGGECLARFTLPLLISLVVADIPDVSRRAFAHLVRLHSTWLFRSCAGAALPEALADVYAKPHFLEQLIAAGGLPGVAADIWEHPSLAELAAAALDQHATPDTYSALLKSESGTDALNRLDDALV